MKKKAEVFTGEKVSSVDDAIKVCKIVLERKEFDIGVGVIVTLGLIFLFSIFDPFSYMLI